MESIKSVGVEFDTSIISIHSVCQGVHAWYSKLVDTFPVSFVVGIISLSHRYTLLDTVETIRLVRVLPAKVEAPSNLVREVLQTSVWYAVV